MVKDSVGVAEEYYYAHEENEGQIPQIKKGCSETQMWKTKVYLYV